MTVFENPQNVTSMVDVLTYLNTITQNWFGAMIIIIITGGMFIFGSVRNSKESIMITGFVMSVISFFMWQLGLISFGILFIPVVMFIMGVVMAMLEKPSIGG